MINDQRLIKQIYKFPYKIKHKDFGEVKKLELIYRASRDGFHSMNFHSKCDYQGETLSILQTESKTGGIIRIFGGYTDIEWKSSGSYISGNRNSFLFSIRNDGSIVRIKSKIHEEVYHNLDFLCCFGNDLSILSCCNKHTRNNSEIGYYYDLP